MNIEENISLKPYNTFAIDVKARWFAPFKSVSGLQEVLTAHLKPNDLYFVMGGGSNVLFTGDFDGIILKNEISGIEKIKEDEESVYIKVGAGMNWHQLVRHCIGNNWAGLENLSLIPGCVGASPMQNIGAYGVELKEVFHELTAFHIRERTNYTFGLKDCEFAYRDSVFKRKYKDQFIITHVCFRLNKIPVFHTSYGALEKELESMGLKELTIKAVSDAVIRIRTSKLPDPAEIGNAGSFFKNPSVSKEKFRQFQMEFENIVGYENEDGSVKLAAGWLIEKAGWKGYRSGDAGVYSKQSLVLVNYNNASGHDIYELSERILRDIEEKFGVLLEREVNII